MLCMVSSTTKTVEPMNMMVVAANKPSRGRDPRTPRELRVVSAFGLSYPLLYAAYWRHQSTGTHIKQYADVKKHTALSPENPKRENQVLRCNPVEEEQGDVP